MQDVQGFRCQRGKIGGQLDLCLIDGEYRGDKEETPKTGWLEQEVQPHPPVAKKEQGMLSDEMKR